MVLKCDHHNIKFILSIYQTSFKWSVFAKTIKMYYYIFDNKKYKVIQITKLIIILIKTS